MFQPVTAVASVEGEPPTVFIGRENGELSKYNNAAEVNEVPPSLILSGHTAAVTAIVAVSADDVYTASIDGTVRQWNTAAEVEGKRDTRTISLPTQVRSLAVAGEVVYAGGQNGTLYVITGADVGGWTGHTDSIVSIAQLEGLVCTASYDNHVRVWDSTGRCQFVLVGHENRVKAVQLLSATSVMSIATDETVRLWTLPEVAPQEGGGAQDGVAAVPAAGEEGADSSPAGSAGDRPPTPTQKPFAPIVRAVAVVPFAGQPLALAVAGANSFVGTSGGGLISINTRELQQVVTDFQEKNRKIVRDEKTRVEKERIERSNKMRVSLRRAIAKKKKELRQLERDAAAAAYAEKIRALREAQQENEDEEAAVDEPPPEDEVAEDAPLTAEHEEELATFTAEQEALTQKRIEEAKGAATARVESIAPILSLVYSTTRESFFRLPFTRHYNTGVQDGVLGIAVTGRTAYVGSGASVRPIVVIPGVTVV